MGNTIINKNIVKLPKFTIIENNRLSRKKMSEIVLDIDASLASHQYQSAFYYMQSLGKQVEYNVNKLTTDDCYYLTCLFRRWYAIVKYHEKKLLALDKDINIHILLYYYNLCLTRWDSFERIVDLGID